MSHTEPDGRQARSGFFTPACHPQPAHVIDVRGLFYDHTMRDRIVMLVRVLEVLSLAHWLVTELSKLPHVIANAFL